LNAKKKYEREHVTPYIWDNPGRFKVSNYANNKMNYFNKFRLTLDYKEDFFVISKIFNELYPKNTYFTLEDIIKYLKKNMNILINKKFLKVNWFRHHLKDLKTISKKDTKLKYL
jgi:spore coat polysaccharide biosynthesis protein SpsF